MKVTINDIAKIANVSKATVSRVINNKAEGVSVETRDKILKLVDEYSYQPSMIARGLVTKKTKTIGLIIPDIANPFFPLLVRGAEDYAYKFDYHIFLCNTDRSVDKERSYLKSFVEKSVDGVILTSNISEGDSQYELFKKHNIPCVLLDRHVEFDDYEAGVYLDNVKGAYMATKLLLDHGHERIAFISGPMSVATSTNRLKGFETACEEKGVAVQRDLILEGDYSLDSGNKLIHKLLEKNKRFTAVFAGNDMMAFGAMKAMKSKGIIIPDDVEVVGFDNIELSQIVEPALTTIAQPAYKMGAHGAMLLIKLIEGKKLKKKNIILEPELIIRGTTIQGSDTYENTGNR